MKKQKLDYRVFLDKLYSYPKGQKIKIDVSRLSENSIKELQQMISRRHLLVDAAYLRKLDSQERKDIMTGNVLLPICVYIKNTEIQGKQTHFLPEENVLAKRYPKLALEWHPTKNGEMTTDKVRCSSKDEVWWQCPTCGHEWQASVFSRCTNGTGCRECKKLKQKEYLQMNNVSVTHPELAAEWHPTNNGELTPQEITAGSRKKPWWQCPTCGHEWQAFVFQRAKGTGCPECQKLLKRKKKQ